MASALPIAVAIEDAESAPARATFRLLVHERAFVALYGAVVVRLAVIGTSAAWHEASWWLALTAASIALAWWCQWTPTAAAWRVRLAAYLLLMNVAYVRLATVFAVAGGPRRDAALRHLDTVIFGAPLPLLFDRMDSPILSELLSGCYLLLFPYLVVACLRHAARWRTAPRDTVRFYEGLFTVYAIGFVGYLLVPAQGMWLDAPAAFAHPISGGRLTALDARVIAAGSSRVDVFPSLHVAVSAFILAFDGHHAPRWARCAVLPTLGLWLSTVYLRYHYGVDIVAGFATAAIGLALAFRRPPVDALAYE